jgi:hypothetical protein
MNIKPNRGGNLELLLAAIFAAYETQGEAVLEKVDPPTKTFGKGRIIHLPNPFLDFQGTWTRQGGRALVIEAKHTEKPTLGVAAHGGITEAQWETALRWHRGGAIVLFIWRFANQAPRMITPAMAAAALRERSRKSLRWADAIPVQPGTGMVLYDFLATARAIFNLPAALERDTNKAP